MKFMFLRGSDEFSKQTLQDIYSLDELSEVLSNDDIYDIVPENIKFKQTEYDYFDKCYEVSADCDFWGNIVFGVSDDILK